MTNPINLPYFYCMYDIPVRFDSTQYLLVSHMIGPTEGQKIVYPLFLNYFEICYVYVCVCTNFQCYSFSKG